MNWSRFRSTDCLQPRTATQTGLNRPLGRGTDPAEPNPRPEPRMASGRRCRGFAHKQGVDGVRGPGLAQMLTQFRRAQGA